MSDTSKTNPGKPTASDRDRPASDKLAELEARYARRKSGAPPPQPVSSHFPVELTLPGLRAKLNPTKFRAWAVGALATIGIVGVPTYVIARAKALKDAHARVVAIETKQAQLDDQLSTFNATLTSHGNRIKSLEGAPNAPLVVTH